MLWGGLASLRESFGGPSSPVPQKMSSASLPLTGGLLSLLHTATGLSLALVVERRGESALLARPTAPYARLMHGRGQRATAPLSFVSDASVGAGLWVLRGAPAGQDGGEQGGAVGGGAKDMQTLIRAWSCGRWVPSTSP